MPERPRPHRPVLALTLAAAGAALVFLPTLAEAAVFERERVRAGELWRLLSGHLVHATPRLALVDLTVLLVLGVWWELRSRAAFAAIVVTSALAASLALLVATPFERYSGSSALGSGLFTALALEFVLARQGPLRLAGVLLLVLFAGKCVLEAAGRGALFASLPPGTEVAAAAHAAGGAAGALVALARRARALRRSVEL